MRNKLKEQGEINHKEWISFVQRRKLDAERRIKDKIELELRIKSLLEDAEPDHETAIAELQP